MLAGREGNSDGLENRSTQAQKPSWAVGKQDGWVPRCSSCQSASLNCTTSCQEIAQPTLLLVRASCLFHVHRKKRTRLVVDEQPLAGPATGGQGPNQKVRETKCYRW